MSSTYDSPHYGETTVRFKPKRRIVSVFLEKHDDGDQIHIWYCPTCRNPILKYQGETVHIIPGLSPTKLPLLVKCKNKNCGVEYNFEAFVVED